MAAKEHFGGTRLSSLRIAMPTASPRSQPPLRRSSARHRFALAGLALALAAGLGAPALARQASTSLRLPIESTSIGLGLLVALGFLATGWKLGRRVDHLSEEARRDPVTKVGNRRHWEECLAHEVDRANKSKMPMSILMLDVDHLKKLNDDGGHASGDMALTIVGKVLNLSCRSRDVAARFGGDEFAVLLPRTKASEARVVAERIRSELAKERRGQSAPLDKLTVSIGIADLASVDEPRAAAVFRAADRALYVAKNAGRDRIEVYERMTHAPSTVIVLDDRRRARKKHRSTTSERKPS